MLPAHWSLGYHQCRWNYVSTGDIRTVQKRFDEEDMPVDVFWLDIEYAEDHKYFMWNPKTFPDPVDMANDVAARGRKVGTHTRMSITPDNLFLAVLDTDGCDHRSPPETNLRLPSV